MINPTVNIMPFLADLERNNNKPWFDKNRDRYKAATADFQQMITDIIELLSDTDKELIGVTAKQSIYRIYRDLRFSLDKTPYKTHFAANIAVGGKNTPRCGFYVQLEPGRSMCGGGLWIEDKNILKAVRDELAVVPEDLVEILGKPSFKKFFPDGLWDYQKLKKVPTGYNSNAQHAELLKYKHFIVTNNLSDSLLASSNLYSHIANAHREIFPMTRLFNSILEDAGLV